MRGLMNNWAPIAGFDSPSRASTAICASCGVSSPRLSSMSSLGSAPRGAFSLILSIVPSYTYRDGELIETPDTEISTDTVLTQGSPRRSTLAAAHTSS
jgi:hypothetical protein